MDTLTGSVERITYYNPENGYSVIRLRPDRSITLPSNREDLVTVTGNLPELAPGVFLRLQGRWVNHPKHGRQFQSEVCEQAVPATVAGIRRYLGSGLIKGIGPRLAERLVRQFGENTLDVIETSPERLVEAPDIGFKRAHSITQAWEEQKQVKDIMLFLHGHGVSTNLAIKIYKQYGDQSLSVVQNDPYRLAADIFGVGFKTADKIARSLGLPANHPSRIEAGVIYILNEMTAEGHVFAPYNILADKAVKLLEIEPALIPSALDQLAQDQRIHHEILPFLAEEGSKTPPTPIVGESAGLYGKTSIYLSPFYYGEIGVAERLKLLSSCLISRLSDIPPAFITVDPLLTAEQQAAIRTALNHPVSILTGGPGTGKTTCLKALITILEAAKKRYGLSSPTGRAAKRLSEATNRPAFTIHRLLGYSPGEGFKHNSQNPLDLDLLVVDEASMLDLLLANHLLKALQPGAHLVLVGDVDQLPSVAAGDVLRNLIDSGIAPVSRLCEIFRQAAGSRIITNAHRINQGISPLFPKDGQDFFLFPAEKPEDAAQWVQELVSERIPHKFGLHPLQQIQVLAPMYRGLAGVDALNTRLQLALNPENQAKPEKILFGQLYRKGDKVMQIQNNYDKDVYNGDIGSIANIDLINHELIVDFEGRRITYDFSEADQLTLAYAISVHKAQGSEFPAVVIPVLTAHYLMLQRNLLYTAVTRARQLCVLVGNRQAIGIAVKNNKVANRYTALNWRLGR